MEASEFGGLGEDFFDDLAVDIGEAEISTLEAVGHAGVIEAEEMERGGLEIVDVDGVGEDIDAEVIGFAVGDAWFDAPAGHPRGVSVGVMVPAPAFAVVEFALDERGATEFAAPDDESILEETEALEILDEGGAGLIGIAALGVEFGGQGIMLIPASVHELNAAGTAFDQAPRHQAVMRESAWFIDLGPVAFENLLWFLRKVGEFGDAGLHPERHFVLGDAGGDFGVAGFVEFEFVDFGEVIEEAAFDIGTEAIGVGEVENRFIAAAELDSLVAGGEEA